MSKTPHTSHHEIYAIRRARNIFLGLLRDGRHKLPVKNRKCTPLRCTAVKKILLSGEQLQLARKCDWTSLRANIICFVRQPVFFKFRSRKLNAQTNVRAYNLQARKCNWISLRADIICFVSWTVFLMFCSRKIAYFEEQIIFMDKFSSLIEVIVFIIPQILLRENILLGQNLTQFSDVLWFDCLNKKLFSSSTSNTQKQYALPSTLYHTGNIRW